VSFSQALFNVAGVIAILYSIVNLLVSIHGRPRRNRRVSERPSEHCERSPYWNGSPPWSRR